MATDPTIRIELVEAGGGAPAGAVAPIRKPPTEAERSAQKAAEQEKQTIKDGGVAAGATKKSQDAKTASRFDQIGAAAREASGIASGLGFQRTAGLLGKGGIFSGALSKTASLLGIGQAGAAAGTAAGGAAGGGLLATGGAAIAASGPLAPIVAGVLATAAVGAIAAKIGLSIARKQAQELAFASPALAGAQARVEAQDIQSRIRRAEVIGDELATIEETRGGISRDIEEIRTVFMEPLLGTLGDILTIIEATTGPVSDFIEQNSDDISRLNKFAINMIAPLTLIIEWGARLAGRPEEREGPDPLGEIEKRLNALQINPNVMGRQQNQQVVPPGFNADQVIGPVLQ